MRTIGFIFFSRFAAPPGTSGNAGSAPSPIVSVIRYVEISIPLAQLCHKNSFLRDEAARDMPSGRVALLAALRMGTLDSVIIRVLYC